MSKEKIIRGMIAGAFLASSFTRVALAQESEPQIVVTGDCNSGETLIKIADPLKRKYSTELYDFQTDQKGMIGSSRFEIAVTGIASRNGQFESNNGPLSVREGDQIRIKLFEVPNEQKLADITTEVVCK